MFWRNKKSGDLEIPRRLVGSLLGMWEPDEKSSKIAKFVSTGESKAKCKEAQKISKNLVGPKSYAITYFDDETGEQKTTVKAKGFTLSPNSPITIERMEELVLNQNVEIETEEQNVIRRDWNNQLCVRRSKAGFQG